MNLVLFGPPGAGKGTQADFIVKAFNLHKISTGDLLRNEIEKNTVIGDEIKSLIEKGSFVIVLITFIHDINALKFLSLCL